MAQQIRSLVSDESLAGRRDGSLMHLDFALLSMTELRTRPGEILDRVADGGEMFLIERGGRRSLLIRSHERLESGKTHSIFNADTRAPMAAALRRLAAIRAVAQAGRD